MTDLPIQNKPANLENIQSKCREIGFTMPSDELVGSLLRILAASKPAGNFLELGTGIGLSLSWIVDGMCANSKVVSIDNDPELVRITNDFFEGDPRVSIQEQEGSKWINAYKGELFDLVFADAWPGKYSHLDKTLAFIKPGGFYVVDDMLEQPNWPDGHHEKAGQLVNVLEAREDFQCTKLKWSTGVIIMTKIAL